MTDPIQPRPQPVVDVAGHLGGLAKGAFTAVFVLVNTIALQGVTRDNIGVVGDAIALAVAAVAGLVMYVVSLFAAKKATPHVTPLADPRDAHMRPLEADVYGKHAAPTDEGGDWQGWYDRGSVLPPASSWVNNTGEPIPVVAADHLDDHSPYMGEDALDSQEPPRMKLGRLPNSGKPRIRLTADLIPSAAYNPPPSVDYYSRVPASSWGMDGNDNWGDCTCAEVDHTTKARQVAAGNTEVKSSASEVLALYSAVTGFDPAAGPSGRNPTDRGAEMQAVRDYWRKTGATLGGTTHKLLLFAEVEHQDHMLVKWCIDRFGALGVGINFPDTAMQQFDAGQPWDVVKGAGIEGGHAIAAVGYDDRFVHVVTWGRVQPMTWAFWDAYTEEAWADLDDSFVSSVSGDDPLGETLYQLGEQFAAVTGKTNPIPVPSPQPDPTPAPSPAPAPSGLPTEVLAWARRVVAHGWYSHRDRQAAQELLTWAGQ